MHRMPAALTLSLFVVPVPAQESAAVFDAPLVTVGSYDRYGFLTDLDLDGFQDALSWWWAGANYDVVRLRGHRNDGTGKLVATWFLDVSVGEPVGYTSTSLRVLPCNLDSDGSTDICLVFSRYGHASIRVLRSRGLSTPELVDDYSVTWTGLTSFPELHAVVADFSGDGQADLAYSFDGRLELKEFVPGQPGLTLRSSTHPFGGPASVVEGLMEIDANGDTTPDLLAWRDATIQMIAIEACQPTETQAHSQGIVADHMPAMGDVDGDGDADLVIWDMSRYVLARRTGVATWSIEPAVTGGPAEFLVDVDQDGDLDGVCCGGGGGPSTPTNTVTSTLRVSVNDGTGAFAPSIETPWLGSDHLAGIADLDHDGDLDVVAGRCILYARGPLTQRLHPLLGAQQSERSVADVDGDSDPDFTVGLRTMVRNHGDGSHSPYDASLPVPPPGTQFIGPGWPGDFDGDGDTDLVVRHNAGATLLAQRLLANLGGGAFADAGDAGPSGVSFNPGTQSWLNNPESSLAADVDGDGDVDLLTRKNASSCVWWNDGVGHFTAGPGFPDESIHWVGDLTGDGIPDIVAGWPAYPGASYGDLGWHEGLGGGAFAARVEHSPNPGGRIAVADLDADGDLDLAIAYIFRLNVYWNEGGGVFTTEWVSSVNGLSNSSGHRVWSTDIDDDGLLDLLITGSESVRNGLIVLRRRADNSGWQTPVTQVISASYPPDAVACDVDGDGDEDFVTDRLIRNGAHSPPRAGERRQVGAGSPGTDGLVPTLGAEGPFRVHESAELRIRGGLGGASGLLTITLVHGGEHGQGRNGWIASTSERILAQVPFTLSGPAGTAGTGSWTLPFTVREAFASQTRRYVAEIYDPGAPGGVARSNTMLITYGP